MGTLVIYFKILISLVIPVKQLWLFLRVMEALFLQYKTGRVTLNNYSVELVKD